MNNEYKPDEYKQRTSRGSDSSSYVTYPVVCLKKVVQNESLLTHIFVKVFRYGNYGAKGRELYLTSVDKNTVGLLQAPGLGPEALNGSAYVA
jgi:hypothetical protein